MTATPSWVTVIDCDHPNCGNSLEGRPGQTAWDVRETIRRYGWTLQRRPLRDYCEMHSEVQS